MSGDLRRFSNPIADYLVKGALVRVKEHGRDPLACEVTKSFSAVHGTVEVHPLGWPHAVVLHASGIADARMVSPDGTLSHAEFREIRRKQREDFERERGTSASMDDSHDHEMKEHDEHG